MIDFKIKKLSEMTVKEKIGQMVMGGFPSTYYDETIEELVDEYYLGNVILFTRNYNGADLMKKLCTDIHTNIINKCGTLPLISIDQEGGSVTRMMKEVAFAPSAMTCGATAVKDASYKCGKALARDMISLGINMNLAPCLEINNECMNFTHNIRSYGSDPNKVSKFVKRFIDGANEYGIISTCKHFPGGGDSTRDSHLELPRIDADFDRIWNFTLTPFKENTGVSAVMSTHILFPALDKDYPTTLSKPSITGLLREKLGYDGIVISDGLMMRAISDKYGVGDAGLMFLKAGGNIALVCHEKENIIKLIKRLWKAYEDGELTDELIDERVSRILRYKEKTIEYLNKYFNNDNKFVADKKVNEEMQEIVDKSITLIKGKKPKIGKNTLVLCPVASVASQAEDVFDERDLAKELKKYYNNTIYKFEKSEEFKELINNEMDKYDDVVIMSYDCSNDQNQIDVINNCIAKKKDKVYVISLKGPMDGRLFKDLKNYMVLYEYTPNSIRTLIKFFKGELECEGKLPL